MMLIANGLQALRNPARYFGATAHAGAQLAWTGNGARRAALRDPSVHKNGLPSGTEPPYCWALPQKGGGLASFNEVYGSGELAAEMALGKALTAELTGSGDITDAQMSLIVSFLATLEGDSGLTASMRGAIQMAAELVGDGDISAALGVIAWCGASLTGSGSLDGSNLTGIAKMSAEILSYGELTPEGLRDAVWKAAASNYSDAGTMGAKLNSAASGGVDLNALADAVWDHVDATAVSSKLALVEKILRNKTITDPNTGEFVLYDDDGTTELFRVPLWEDAAGTQPYRGQGGERRERLV